MKALIITHHPDQGLGILKERDWEMDEVGLWNGNSLPGPTPLRSQRDKIMKLIPGAYEILAYLVQHEAQLSEWEHNFVSNMQYWLKVRKREPDHVQLMMLTTIYNRVKKPD